MSRVDVSAIIISLNSKFYLSQCLQSLLNAAWDQVTYELIVVDNGSTDGTLEMMSKEYPAIQVVANSRNEGYCRAGNQGAEVASGRFLLFLNDDILILEDALPKLVHFMDATPHAGMIGSRLLNLDRSDQFSSGRRFPTPMNAIFARRSAFSRLFPNAVWCRNYLMSDKINSETPYEVDWISAAAMMVRQEVFHKIGGFAEDYYYWHELIICARSTKAGHPVYLHPQSRIVHYEGAGSGVRTRKVRCRHIERMHSGAYRWYCLHYQLGPFHPARLLVGGLLACRAVVLLGLELFQSGDTGELSQLNAGRPEGGIPI